MVRCIILLALLWACLGSCRTIDSQDLIGVWEISHVMDNEDTVHLDHSSVRLFFQENGRFLYQYNYKDSLKGIYRTNRKIIDLMIDYPSADTLRIQISEFEDPKMALVMNHNGSSRVVQLERVLTQTGSANAE